MIANRSILKILTVGLRATQFALVCAVVSSACKGSADAGRSMPHVVDSAGIVTVVDHAPDRTIQDLTRLGEPVATIGPDYPLSRVGEAIVLSDGRVVLLEASPVEVLVVGPGSDVQVLASRGRGPGEVMRPANLQRLAADSVQIYDRLLARITVFAPDGAVAYEIPMNTTVPPPLSVMRMQDTLLVGLSRQVGQRHLIARTGSAELGRTPLVAIRYDLRGQVIDTVAELSGYADIRIEGSSLAPIYGLSVPFGATPSGAVAFGTGDLPEVRILDGDGRLRRIHRLAMAREPVPIDSLASVLAEDLPRSGAGPDLDGIHRLLLEFVPDSQPAYSTIKVTQGGAVWLGSAEPFGHSPRRWNVLSNDGQWVASVHVPDRAHILNVDGNFLVLRRLDDLDVPHLEVYDLGDHFAPESGG